MNRIILGATIFTFLILALFSCKTEITERKDYKDVMEVHDIAMARMGEIYDYKSKIEEMKLTLQDSSLSGSANKLILALENADEKMMDWMANFRVPEGGNEKELISYFAEEQKKVNIVDKDINDAIAEAKEFVENQK